MTNKNSNEFQTPPDATFRFGEFELSPAARSLQRNGQPVPLAPKTFDALLALLRNSGRLVRKSDFMDSLWPSTFVNEASLTNVIVSLRKVLGKDAIQTVSKHGYRFALPLRGEPGIARATYDKFIRAKELTLHRSLESMSRAREMYWLCLAEDPAFAPAWAWLGRCCWFLGKFGGQGYAHVELAEAAIQRAFAIDPDLACAHQFYTPMQADIGEAQLALERLQTRIKRNRGDPESYTGLVQVFRFCGLPAESLAAHRRAADLDPTVVTSVPHTLFLTSDYAAAIEFYSGRTGFYLDAASWAAIGENGRAATLLRERLTRQPPAGFMAGLITSLLAIVEARDDEAIACLDAMTVENEPEAIVYIARHYSFLGASDAAAAALRRASESGFVCAPETLRADPWFNAVRNHPEFARLLAETERRTASVRLLVEVSQY